MIKINIEKEIERERERERMRKNERDGEPVTSTGCGVDELNETMGDGGG